MHLGELKDKKVLILGLGKEGVDSFRFLRRLFPNKIFGIGDRVEIKNLKLKIKDLIKKDKHIKPHFGEDYLRSIKKYDIIIKAPGIPPRIIKPFITKKQKVTSQTEIFFENFKGTIVGVTGTKGKGTTCSLIYQILKKGGLKTHLVGNIGKPVFQVLLKSGRDDIFVYELSSHQLQNLKKSPHVAVFLNLYPDHLDYYENFQEYQEAKRNIALYQTKEDFYIYNKDDKIVRELARKSKVQKFPFSLNSRIYGNSLANQGSRAKREVLKSNKGNWVLWGKEKIINKKEIPLRGDFNILNVMAAVSVGKILNVPNKTIREAIKSFKSLPHRLEFVGKYKGIEFYNDSMSTIPEVTVAALDALGKKVKTLIIGGSDKGSDYSKLARKILKSKLRTLIIFPGTGEKIWQKILALRKNNLPQSFFANSMKEAVKVVYHQAHRGEICLLSPAAASFNLFEDYKQRGNLFKKYIREYGHE